MKQIDKSIDFSGYLTNKSAFAPVDTKPQNNPPAYSCHGYKCYIEGQKCLAGTPGSLGVNWTCKSRQWVRD